MKTFKQLVKEKKLTPAEKKKREEVAQAIERDNPDMPMAKKMAIATSTAKRVAEASVTRLSNYMRKSAADAAKPGTSASRQDKRIGGQKMADDKIRKMQGKSSASKVAATSEDVEKTADVKMFKYRNPVTGKYSWRKRKSEFKVESVQFWMEDYNIDQQTAETVIKVYESLNNTNAEKFINKLDNGGQDLQNMINFASKVVGN